MASTIITKNGTSGAPSSLTAGELAINTTDGGIYYGSTGGTSVSSSFKFGAVTASVVSASGTVTAAGVRLPGAGVISFDNSLDGTDQLISGNDNNIVIDGDDYIKNVIDTEFWIGPASNNGKFKVNADGVIITPITASGNISASGNVEGGSLRADDLTAGRVAFVGTDGLLVDDSDLTFATATLTATNIAAFTLSGKLTAGSSEIEGSNFDISGGTIGGEIAIDASGGELTTSATQNLGIVQGAAADIDIGTYSLTVNTLVSDVADGTAPLTVSSRTVVSNLNADKLDGADLIDEDNMASDSATRIPTQQSVKAYADTKVSSAAQKQLTHHSYKADQGTTKTYIGLMDADSEETTTSQKLELPIIAPANGKLLKIFLRSNKNIQSHSLTWRLETIAAANFSATPNIIGTQTGDGCQNSAMTTYDFTGVTSNAVSAGNAVYISLESDTDFGNVVSYFITCMWEWDLS